MKKLSAIVLLIGSMAMITAAVPTTQPADGDATTKSSPTGTRNIFKPPEETDITDISKSSTPWLKDEFVPIVNDFKKNLKADLKESPEVQKIWNQKFDSATIRKIYFKLGMAYFTKLNHPAPAALANIVSKSGSLFDSLTIPLFFDNIAITQPELLLIHNINVDQGTSKTYVGIVSSELQKVDTNDPEAVWGALLESWAKFVQSQGLNPADTLDQTFEIFPSNFIVLNERQKAGV